MSDEGDLREQVFGTVAVWHGTLPLEHLQALVDAVLALPALREYGDRRAAEELEAAAERLWSGPEMRAALRDRAAALRGEAADG